MAASDANEHVIVVRAEDDPADLDAAARQAGLAREAARDLVRAHDRDLAERVGRDGAATARDRRGLDARRGRRRVHGQITLAKRPHAALVLELTVSLGEENLGRTVVGAAGQGPQPSTCPAGRAAQRTGAGPVVVEPRAPDPARRGGRGAGPPSGVGHRRGGQLHRVAYRVGGHGIVPAQRAALLPSCRAQPGLPPADAPGRGGTCAAAGRGRH